MGIFTLKTTTLALPGVGGSVAQWWPGHDMGTSDTSSQDQVTGTDMGDHG